MKQKIHAGVRELGDEQLAGVYGGQGCIERGGRRYRYIGDASGAQVALAKVLARCGAPLRYNSWLRFRCDACDENWYYEDELVVNLAGGVWQELPGA